MRREGGLGSEESWRGRKIMGGGEEGGSERANLY